MADGRVLYREAAHGAGVVVGLATAVAFDIDEVPWLLTAVLVVGGAIARVRWADLPRDAASLPPRGEPALARAYAERAAAAAVAAVAVVLVLMRLSPGIAPMVATVVLAAMVVRAALTVRWERRQGAQLWRAPGLGLRGSAWRSHRPTSSG